MPAGGVSTTSLAQTEPKAHSEEGRTVEAVISLTPFHSAAPTFLPSTPQQGV